MGQEGMKRVEGWEWESEMWNGWVLGEWRSNCCKVLYSVRMITGILVSMVFHVITALTVCLSFSRYHTGPRYGQR